MSLNDELAAFYASNHFGNVVGARPLTVPVYTGCMLVPLPNIETRRRYLKYHDLHHLLTGYSVGRIGEGEVSAWELGTGSAFAACFVPFPREVVALSPFAARRRDRGAAGASGSKGASGFAMTLSGKAVTTS